MNIHEYQAKEVLRSFGVPTGKGHAAFSVDEAMKSAESMPGPVWVVKAQIHAGGRGKGGGVKVVKSVAEVKAEATTHAGHDSGNPSDRALKASLCNVFTSKKAPPLPRSFTSPSG